MVTVQFGAVPAKTIFPIGSKAAFELVAATEVAHANVLSTSVIVNAIAPVAVSSAVVWFTITEITGASFTAVTVKLYALAAESNPSVTVNTTFETPL